MLSDFQNPDQNHRGSRQPIAIVSMGCRLPGGIQSPSGFWELLVEGRDGIADVPADRWNSQAYYSADRVHAGKIISGKGGFVRGIDLFDPEFFGISDSEAPYLDPQHRLLLEVTWEAFERAGLVLEHHRGQPVGVFIGCFTSDYLHMQFADPYQLGAYTATGSVGTMAAARISHTFDFRGPSMTVDTACSSSLHSVHLACESLRAGDCDVAVAGGSQLTLIPEFNIAETKGGFLSDSSQCRMFDAAARGYVRSEAIAVALLKRLPDALACGDPIQAVILGSAMNQDGHTATISYPNPEAQKDVLRRACVRAGISPSSIHYVEAHGTGTLAGDRAEAEAIGTMFRVDPGCSSELLVGSVKTNIGHAEAAAGICGLMKAALTVKHRIVPPNLHFQTPNPAIDFEQLRLRVPVVATPVAAEPVVAVVNSFGFGGSNAALVLRGPCGPESAPPVLPEPRQKAFLLPVSARSGSALRSARQSLESWLRHWPQEFRVEDLCHTAGVRRAHLEHRRAFAFSDLDALRDQLAPGVPESNSRPSLSAESRPGTVWVFSGAGNVRYQTGLHLFRDEPVFRDILEQCDEVYRGLSGFSVIDVMRSRPAEEFIREAWLAHPVTVSVQMGLAALFRKWGVAPAAIVGHSLGETAAFYAAGVYDLQEALQLVFVRCQCLKPLHGTGGLLAVAADEDSIRAALDGSQLADDCDWAIAAMNGPAAVTLSARGAALAIARERLNKAGIPNQQLAELYSCHHHYPALEAAAEALGKWTPTIPGRSPHTLLYSAVTGAEVDAPPPSSYWPTHLVEPVKLRPVISMLANKGFRRFLELAPHSALTSSLAATAGNHACVLPTLHRRRDERMSLLNALGALYESGEDIDWLALYPSGAVVDLPSYPWQRRRFWREPEASRRHRTRPETSNLLGERLGPTVWQTEVSTERFAFLLDHVVAGKPLFPASGYVEMALSAGKEHFAGHPFVVEDLRFRKAVPLHRGSAFFLEFHLDAAHGTFCIYATPSLTTRSAQRVAEGKLRSLPPGFGLPAGSPVQGMPEAGALKGEWLYQRFAQLRYAYRGTFRGIRRAWVDGNHVCCEIELPQDLDATGYCFHPAVLDAAFQAILCVRVAAESEDAKPVRLEVPDSIGSMRVLGIPRTRMVVRARVCEADSGTSAELAIFDSSERIVAHIADFKTRRVELTANAASRVDRCLYQTEWSLFRSRDAPGSGIDRMGSPVWIILSDGDAGDVFARRLREQGIERVIIGSYRPALDSSAVRPSLEEILDREPTVAGLIHLGNLECGPTATQAWNSGQTSCDSVLSVAQALHRRGVNVKLWVVTKGAYRIRPSDPPADPLQAACWGLARAIGQREQATAWGGLIDLSCKCLPCESETAVDSILQPDGEDQFAIRERDRLVLRLRRMAPWTATRPPEITFRHDAPYLVAGAFGALGNQVARWMIAHGARRLILPDRSHDLVRRAPFICELESAGAVVEVVDLDLANCDHVAAYCDQRRCQNRPPIRGVIYCAGRSCDQLAFKIDRATFHEVLSAKAVGAWAFHRAFQDASLEHFVLFSSAASILPVPGMGAYAAANAFLDALADHRRAMELPALSIAWGPWEIGMTERRGVKEYLGHTGFQCLSPAQGIQLLENLWHSRYPAPVALAADWRLASAQGQMRIPILEDLQRELELDGDPADDSSDGREARGAGQSQQSGSTEERLRGLIAGLISSRASVDMAIPLVDQGLDSLGATVFSETLFREFGLNIGADAFADGLNLRNLLARIAGAAAPG
jgi:acyl transferase domain-containing protein